MMTPTKKTRGSPLQFPIVANPSQNTANIIGFKIDGVIKHMSSDKESSHLTKGDRYMLECGHEGRIVWVSENSEIIGVSGVRRSCRTCGKKTSGNWSPYVYLINVETQEDE
jgi:hypothetical protein